MPRRGSSTGFPAAQTPPKAIDSQKWASFKDYPSAALRRKAGGETDIRVTVSPDGKPTDCFIVDSSHFEDLDRQACALIMRNARFVPATGKDGKPRVGLYSAAFIWWGAKSFSDFP